MISEKYNDEKPHSSFKFDVQLMCQLLSLVHDLLSLMLFKDTCDFRFSVFMLAMEITRLANDASEVKVFGVFGVKLLAIVVRLVYFGYRYDERHIENVPI